MPPVTALPGQSDATIFSKMKMGAMMGGTVGLSIGFIFGTFAILRSGAGPKGFLPSLSGYMLTSGATFAFFMSIGSVIRTDGMTMREWAAQQVANRESTRKVPVYLTSRLESSQRLAKEWSAAHQNTKD